MKESAATATIESEVKEAVNTYYAALTAMFRGDLDPIDDIWSHGEDVTLASPLGDIVTGWDNIRDVLEHVAHTLKDGEVKPANVSVRVIGDVGIATLREQGYNTTNDGQTVQVDVRATNVYCREGGQWKMIHHHADSLPDLEKAIMG